ncbi:MAG: hypothetical protein AAGC95_04290 [Pseudomonadota bacterium]
MTHFGRHHRLNIKDRAFAILGAVAFLLAQMVSVVHGAEHGFGDHSHHAHHSFSEPHKHYQLGEDCDDHEGRHDKEGEGELCAISVLKDRFADNAAPVFAAPKTVFALHRAIDPGARLDFAPNTGDAYRPRDPPHAPVLS